MGKHELLEDLLGPVVYRKDVDELAGEYLSEYETIHMSVDLTADERESTTRSTRSIATTSTATSLTSGKRTATQSSSNARPTTRKGRRALIAKQRAERIARTAEKKLDTLDNLLKRHHDDRTIIFTANNDFAYDISREFIVPCITHQTKTDERTEILDRFRAGGTRCSSRHRCSTRASTSRRQTSGSSSRGAPRNAQYAQRFGRILRPTDDRQPARLYEIITEDTMETYVSQRRREG